MGANYLKFDRFVPQTGLLFGLDEAVFVPITRGDVHETREAMPCLAGAPTNKVINEFGIVETEIAPSLLQCVDNSSDGVLAATERHGLASVFPRALRHRRYEAQQGPLWYFQYGIIGVIREQRVRPKRQRGKHAIGEVSGRYGRDDRSILNCYQILHFVGAPTVLADQLVRKSEDLLLGPMHTQTVPTFPKRLVS